jgi:hypothetical protein
LGGVFEKPLPILFTRKKISMALRELYSRFRSTTPSERGGFSKAS